MTRPDLQNTYNQPSATIGLYCGEYGASFHLEVALTLLCIPYEIFQDDDILSPAMEARSALVFGAGQIMPSRTALGGRKGRQRVRDLIQDGSRYVGICAGAYLAMRGACGLRICRLKAEQPAGRSLFQGFLRVQKGRSVFPLWYQNGVVFPRSTSAREVVARFHEKQPPAEDSASLLRPGDLAGRPAIIQGKYGRGSYVLLSPHPELGALGVPGYGQAVQSWTKIHAPAVRANRVPCGRARQRLLEQLSNHIESPMARSQDPLRALLQQRETRQLRLLRQILLGRGPFR